MKLSDYALNELSKYVLGDDGKGLNRSASKLVDLFNQYAQRDIYDFKNGGLPKLDSNQKMNTSRKEYCFDRLRKINNSENLKKLIEQVVNEYPDSTLINEINKIIIPENYRVDKGENIFFIVSADNYEDTSKKEVHFEEIQKKILVELGKAKFQVLIAVAWFTDPAIHQKLIELLDKGINIQIITIDDDINNNSGLDFSRFEIKKFSKYNWDNLMHNKFCVIDLITVINGSYNWTKKAQYNQENITVDTSKQLAEKFALKFMELKKK